MSLSPHELVTIVLGLGGGYWLVSRILEGRNAPDPRPKGFGDCSSDKSGLGDGRSGLRDESQADGARAWWAVLGVPRITTRAEISRAYKRKMSEYHPDKVAQMGAEIRALAEQRSKEINAAYDQAMKVTGG
jgi:hypothetical protein